ncbi:MAG: inorganic diphosphatase [Patescibacteria group bacterium]
MKNNYATQFVGENVQVVMDRPAGSKHPKFGWKYEVNYGYVPGTEAPDGEGIDAYVLGVDEPIKKFEGKCIAVVHRKDDDDDKLIVVPEGVEFSDDEIMNLVNFQEKFFKSSVIRL